MFEPVICGPLEVLHLAHLCPDETGTRVDLNQVRFGRDREGFWAAATDSKVLAVARWAPPDPESAATPTGYEVGIGGTALAAFARTVWRRKPFRRAAQTFALHVGPGGAPFVEVTRFGDPVATLRITTAPPGKWVTCLPDYERQLRNPVAPDPALPSACDPRGVWTLLAGLFDVFAERAAAAAVRPYLSTVPTRQPVRGGADHQPIWCFELAHTLPHGGWYGGPLPMGLRLWACALPLAVGLAPAKAPEPEPAAVVTHEIGGES